MPCCSDDILSLAIVPKGLEASKGIAAPTKGFSRLCAIQLAYLCPVTHRDQVNREIFMAQSLRANGPSRPP